MVAERPNMMSCKIKCVVFSLKTFLPDLGATMEPNKGGTKKTTRPKHQSSDSQGAAGPSASRPNSEGTFKLNKSIKNFRYVSKPRWLIRPAINSDFHGIKRLEVSILSWIGCKPITGYPHH